jgi:hypothetical protein
MMLKYLPLNKLAKEKDMSYVFEVVEDGVIPEWLQSAYEDGETIQMLSSIGWLTLDAEDGIGFHNGLTYRVRP